MRALLRCGTRFLELAYPALERVNSASTIVLVQILAFELFTIVRYGSPAESLLPALSDTDAIDLAHEMAGEDGVPSMHSWKLSNSYS